MMVVTAASSSSKQVGHVLVERGLVTSEQINRALAEQKQSGQAGERKLLGELVVELGYCTEEQVLSALAEAYGVPYVKLGPRLYDPRLMDALPRDFMEKQCVLPLFKVDGVLSVAMHEPANMFLVEELSRLVGAKLR